MARNTNPLSSIQVERAKPQEKEYTLADGDGLLLRIKPNGAKVWLLNYTGPITKKRNNQTLGSYPDISLKQAREVRAEYKPLLARGIDPQEHRQQLQAKKLAEINTPYESVAWAWFEHRKTKKHFSVDYQKDIKSLIERNLLPHFGSLPITQITAPMAIKAFKPYQEAGTLEKLKRTIQKHNEIMTYALHGRLFPTILLLIFQKNLTVQPLHILKRSSLKI